jgi:hypothetical protein
MQPLATNRVAGGVEVQIELWANTGLVLVTRDPAIVREMAESLNQSTRVTAEITAQQINLELADEQLRATDDGQTLNTDSLEEAKNDFLRALGQKAYAECHRLGKDLLHQIAQRRYDDWCALTQPFSSPADCPLAAQACLRPLLSQMRRRVDLQAPSINLLPAGGCDDIQTMIDAGWQVTVAEHQQATATALIDPENVHHGPGCLCLTAPLPLSEQELSSDELPLIWASSPSAKIASNQIFRIDGWVRYECYDAAACLLVFDSLTGPSCGPRIRPTEQWVPFSLYRATDLDSPVSVTFALTAPGRVWIDDVSITPIVSADSLKGGE